MTAEEMQKFKRTCEVLQAFGNLSGLIQQINQAQAQALAQVQEKVVLDNLIIEVTRRCNMHPVCPHCLRGEPQAVDVDESAVDNLLGHISEIGELAFSGGEPTVNLTGMQYVMDSIKRNNIKLRQVNLVTNGLRFDADFAQFCSKADDYISQCLPKSNPDPHMVIGVSRDRYHSNDKGMAFVEWSRKNLKSRKIIVLPWRNGEFTERMGLATNLEQSLTIPPRVKATLEAAIDIEKPADDGNAVIHSALYLSAKGRLYVCERANADYAAIDDAPAICDCNTSFSLSKAIADYNSGRFSRAVWEAQSGDANEQSRVLTEIFFYLNSTVQNPKCGFSTVDQKLAQKDMAEIMAIRNEHQDSELFTVFRIWLKERKSGIPSKTSAYQEMREEVLNAIPQ